MQREVGHGGMETPPPGGKGCMQVMGTRTCMEYQGPWKRSEAMPWEVCGPSAGLLSKTSADRSDSHRTFHARAPGTRLVLSPAEATRSSHTSCPA